MDQVDPACSMHLVCFQSLVCYSHCVSNSSVSDDTFSNHTHEMNFFFLFFLLLLIRSSSNEADQYGYSWSLWMGCSDMGPSLCWKLTVPECLEEPNEVVYPGDLYCALNFTHTHNQFNGCQQQDSSDSLILSCIRM